jgi:hypothetical protein
MDGNFGLDTARWPHGWPVPAVGGSIFSWRPGLFLFIVVRRATCPISTRLSQQQVMCVASSFESSPQNGRYFWCHSGVLVAIAARFQLPASLIGWCGSSDWPRCDLATRDESNSEWAAD